LPPGGYVLTGRLTPERGAVAASVRFDLTP
jgi:hypothetical protein